MRTIRISDEVWEEIARRRQADETPDEVLRRVLDVSVRSEESAAAEPGGLRQSAEETAQERTARANNRQHPRKDVLFRAQVNRIDQEGSSAEEGIILDISEGGLRIMLPSSYDLQIKEDTDDPMLSVSITPQRKNAQDPITIRCVPRYVHRSKTATTVGVSFCNAGEACCEILPK